MTRGQNCMNHRFLLAPICWVLGHPVRDVSTPNWRFLVCNRCENILHCEYLPTNLPPIRSREQELEEALRGVMSWFGGPECNDCTPFRTAPAVDWMHHQRCGALKDWNRGARLLGHVSETGHSLEDPKAEMIRLAEDRAQKLRVMN